MVYESTNGKNDTFSKNWMNVKSNGAKSPMKLKFSHLKILTQQYEALMYQGSQIRSEKAMLSMDEYVIMYVDNKQIRVMEMATKQLLLPMCSGSRLRPYTWYSRRESFANSSSWLKQPKKLANLISKGSTITLNADSSFLFLLSLLLSCYFTMKFRIFLQQQPLQHKKKQPKIELLRIRT